MLVYLFTFPNGKQYIGQTVRMLQTRLNAHRTQVVIGSLLPVHCAWRKHGEPSVSILRECSSYEELHLAEIDAIASHNTVAPNGYNITAGGDTAPSKTPIVAAKIAAAAKGRRASAETKALMSANTTARWDDPEYRAKVSEGLRSSWTDERRALASTRARARMLGHKHSPETRLKLAERAANRSAETRAKMSASAKARIRPERTQQTCDRLAVSIAASWQDPDIRARRSAAIREGHQRRKQRLSELAGV